MDYPSDSSQRSWISWCLSLGFRVAHWSFRSLKIKITITIAGIGHQRVVVSRSIVSSLDNRTSLKGGSLVRHFSGEKKEGHPVSKEKFRGSAVFFRQVKFNQNVRFDSRSGQPDDTDHEGRCVFESNCYGRSTQSPHLLYGNGGMRYSNVLKLVVGLCAFVSESDQAFSFENTRRAKNGPCRIK